MSALPCYSQRYVTPVKKVRKPKVSQEIFSSPVQELQTRTQRILKDLRSTDSFKSSRKLIDEYNSKVKQAEKWVNSRFEMVIQKEDTSQASHFLSPNKSSTKLRVKKILNRDGWSYKQRQLKNNLNSAQLNSPFLSKF